jgi:ketosteroid isomerase-like protein
MSENLDLVRSIYADWERGDYSSAEWAHPAIEYVILRASDFAGVSVQGRVEMREAARANIDAWADLRIAAERYIEADSERVLVLDNVSGRGKRSGLDIKHIAAGGGSAHLFHVAEGKVLRLVVYEDRDRALADLGLAPEAE